MELEFPKKDHEIRSSLLKLHGVIDLIELNYDFPEMDRQDIIHSSRRALELIETELKTKNPSFAL